MYIVLEVKYSNSNIYLNLKLKILEFIKINTFIVSYKLSNETYRYCFIFLLFLYPNTLYLYKF